MKKMNQLNQFKRATMAVAAFVLLEPAAFAQHANIKDIPLEGNQGTTISITKGDSNLRDYDILSSTGEIIGDPDVLKNAARESWKKACADWKAELKELNKENQIIAINCNAPKCATDSTQTTCTSSGTYQMRVKIRK